MSAMTTTTIVKAPDGRHWRILTQEQAIELFQLGLPVRKSGSAGAEGILGWGYDGIECCRKNIPIERAFDTRNWKTFFIQVQPEET
jgi:hypothetical protein